MQKPTVLSIIVVTESIMPRIPDPTSADHQDRMRRYRDRLRELGRPEAAAVDIAVAGAVAEYASAASSDDDLEVCTLRRLLRRSLQLLVDQGYDQDESRVKMITRLGRFATN
jgi:hypothetical protein